MKRKYTVIQVNSLVYVSSSYHHFFSVVIKEHEHRYSRDYSIECGYFSSKHSVTIELPKYVVREVERLIHEGFKAKRFTYHEYDRDGNKRFDDLRYHDADWEARISPLLEWSIT